MGANRAAPGPAVFLDRDGVINQNVFNPATGSYEAPLTVADFALAPGAVPALYQLQSAGYLLFVVSNQPNYAKGKSTLEDLAAIDQKMRRELASSGVTFSGVYYCLHHPEYTGPCACRKPSPYFLLHTIREFHLDPKRSWMIGDRETDILCGRAAGVRTLLVSAEPASLHSNANFVIPTEVEGPALFPSPTSTLSSRPERSEVEGPALFASPTSTLSSRPERSEVEGPALFASPTSTLSSRPERSEVEGPALLSRVHQHWSCPKSRADFTAPNLFVAANQILAPQQQSSPVNASVSNSTRRNPDSRSFASYHSCGV